MKKIKTIIPIITAAAATTAAIPLVSLTSCGNKASSVGNLMTEYTPDSQREYVKEDDQKRALINYLTFASQNNKIFEQDVLYTLSRGVPEFISYTSEYCEIQDADFNASVKVIEIKPEEMNVTFDLTMDIRYDFTGTKYEEMVWYDLSAYKANLTAKARFVFNFDTYDEEFGTSVNAWRKRMTTFAGATQFGINELGSTVQTLSEYGTYVDLKGEEHEVSISDPLEARPFIMPNYDYYVEKYKSEDQYEQRVREVSTLWTEQPAAQIMVYIFEKYMSDNNWDVEGLPNTLGFGSYFMANVSLNDLFTVVDRGNNYIGFDGFNKSLDSVNNTKNLIESKYFREGVFEIPKDLNIDGTNKYVNWIGGFNGSLSKYTNLGLPSAVKTLIIPCGTIDTDKNVLEVATKAFVQNYSCTSIQFNQVENPSSATDYPTFMPEAFTQMYAVNELDFSKWSTTAAQWIMGKDGGNQVKLCFKNIHKGAPIPKDNLEGIVKVKQGADPNSWKNLLEVMGIHVREDATELGWEIEQV